VSFGSSSGSVQASPGGQRAGGHLSVNRHPQYGSPRKCAYAVLTFRRRTRRTIANRLLPASLIPDAASVLLAVESLPLPFAGSGEASETTPRPHQHRATGSDAPDEEARLRDAREGVRRRLAAGPRPGVTPVNRARRKARPQPVRKDLRLRPAGRSRRRGGAPARTSDRDPAVALSTEAESPAR
jgi:hypothetical protein